MNEILKCLIVAIMAFILGLRIGSRYPQINKRSNR